MNNYRASGGGDYLFYKESKTVNDTQTEILEILIEYIVREKDLVIEHKNNIKIVY
jgi:2',3'-cyclic-nucleotide 2'-phosphodiesterase/3'-nucleotidase